MSGSLVDEWVDKVEGNYISAITLIRRRNRPVPDVICNQCHQAAEKYLKALLTRHQIYFPKTHDLMQLESLVVQVYIDVRIVHASLAVLNPYGIDIRYPGLDATVEDSREAVKHTKLIRKYVRAKLGYGS